jgi:hypothetical protein
MENPFNLSDEDLIKLLDAYFNWCNKNEEDKKYSEIERQKARERKKTLLDKEHVQRLSDDELSDKILEYSKKLEGPVGIRIGKPRVSGEINNLKRNILYLINSSDDPFIKAGKILEGDYKIPIFSKSFWSPLFQAQYPELLPNWNNKTDRFLKKLGINVTTSKKKIEEKYKLFSDAFLYLKKISPEMDFFTLDHLTHYGTAIDEGNKLIDEMLNPSFKGFTEKSFQILEKLSRDTSYEAIKPISKDIHKEVLAPIHNIFKKISLVFDLKGVLNLEKEKRIMGNLFKPNPRYGAYPYIWGAFYQKDQKKDTSMQFFIWICKDYLTCGVYYSKHNTDIKNKMTNNFFKNKNILKNYFNEGFFKQIMFFDDNFSPEEKERITYKVNNIDEMEQLYRESNFNIGKILTKEQVIKEGSGIINTIKETFEHLVPAYVLGITAEPMKLLKDYFEPDIKYWRVVEPLAEKIVGRVLWPTCKEKGIIAIGFKDQPDAPDLKNMRDKMKIGDKVVAYLLDKRVGGIGTVIGEFEDYLEDKPEDKNYFNGRFWRRRKIRWDTLPENGNFWELKKAPSGVHQTVFQLTKEEYEKILKEIGSGSDDPKPDPITIITKEEILREIFLNKEKFEQVCCLLENCKKKQIIFQGPPGTGKTFVAQKIAHYLSQSEDRVETIQFHPSYSYEDFIEGYRPKDGKFVLEPGIFKVFCERARENKDKKYILIIDEINRGNLSKIFGELLYLLEYRDKEIRLTYSQDKFSIPENVYIIGTMNTADRSLAIMDYALRRRFYFVDIVCKTKRLEKWLTENGCTLEIGELIGAIENMNKAINDEMHSKDFAIGHSYFMRENLDEKKLAEIINYGIKPLLGEYFFDKDEKVGEITGIMNSFFKKKIIEKIQE